jgi:hypothetical protein
MSSNLMEKILYAWRILLDMSSQSFPIPIPLVFLPYESKEAYCFLDNLLDFID